MTDNHRYYLFSTSAAVSLQNGQSENFGEIYFPGNYSISPVLHYSPIPAHEKNLAQMSEQFYTALSYLFKKASYQLGRLHTIFITLIMHGLNSSFPRGCARIPPSNQE